MRLCFGSTGDQAEPSAANAGAEMRYGFLVDTYETERLKLMSVWAAFQDQDLPFRPHPTDRRGRSVLEHMVHQCVSEDAWFKNMLGLDVGAPAAAADGDASRFRRPIRGRFAQARRCAARPARDVVGGRRALLRGPPLARLDPGAADRAQRPSPRTADGAPADAGPRRLQHLWPDRGHRRPRIHHAPTIYAYADEAALLQGEAAGGRKAVLPGPTAKPPTERPDV